MNLSELEKIMAESGVSVCCICGTPFEPRTKRQRTCGQPDCKRIAHNEYLRERNKRLKEEDPIAFNKYHADANKKWRNKKKSMDERDKELKDLDDRWKRQAEFDRKISEYGDRYGEVSAQKTLEKIPKIDTTL